MKKKVENFRNGLLSLNTRRFGVVMEEAMCKYFNLKRVMGKGYNAINPRTGIKSEIAFSRAFRKNDDISTDIVLECLSSDVTNRIIASENLLSEDYVCNIQQLHINDFDELMYGILTKNKIYVFTISSEELKRDIPIYNGQHRGNKDEKQFRITKKNIQDHLSKYLMTELKYSDVMVALLDD